MARIQSSHPDQVQKENGPYKRWGLFGFGPEGGIGTELEVQRFAEQITTHEVRPSIARVRAPWPESNPLTPTRFKKKKALTNVGAFLFLGLGGNWRLDIPAD